MKTEEISTALCLCITTSTPKRSSQLGQPTSGKRHGTLSLGLWHGSSVGTLEEAPYG